MKNKGATVLWIEEATGELRHKRFNSPPRLGFKTQVEIKHATNPIDILEIHDDWAGNEATTTALERLREKSSRLCASKQ